MRPAENKIQVAPAPPQPLFSLPSKLLLLTSSISFGVMLTLSACIRGPQYRLPRNDMERLMIFACQHLIQQGGVSAQDSSKMYKMTEGEYKLAIEKDHAWIYTWNESQEAFQLLASTKRGGMWEVFEEDQIHRMSVSGRLGKLQ